MKNDIAMPPSLLSFIITMHLGHHHCHHHHQQQIIPRIYFLVNIPKLEGLFELITHMRLVNRFESSHIFHNWNHVICHMVQL